MLLLLLGMSSDWIVLVEVVVGVILWTIGILGRKGSDFTVVVGVINKDNALVGVTDTSVPLFFFHSVAPGSLQIHLVDLSFQASFSSMSSRLQHR